MRNLLKYTAIIPTVPLLFAVLELEFVAIAQYSPPTEITVQMYQLRSNGGLPDNPVSCSSGNTSFGCTAFVGNEEYSYPYGDANPATIAIEADYLLDVVPKEMGPLNHHPVALQAQAIAARTYAYCFIDKTYGNCDRGEDVNNSNAYQVFVPYHFDTLSPVEQRAVQAAVDSRVYVTDAQDEQGAIFAEFSADAYLESNAGDYDYLAVVADPISYDPEILNIIANTGAHQRGMSQSGANRWAYGNASQYGTGEPWSVCWERVEQILVHYYTGVHLRDAEHSDNILTTHYRWNPLSIDWSAIDDQPPMMEHGNAYPATIPVQNTSIYDWPINGQEWAFSYHWARGGFGEVDSDNRAWTTVDVYQSDPPYTFTLSIDDLPAWGPGYYMLQFDVILRAIGTNYWFSRAFDWPTFDVRICVDGCKQVFLPLVLNETLSNAIN